MRSRRVWSWFAAALVVTFVEVARAQDAANAADTPQSAAPEPEAAPRPSLVPTLGRRTPEHLRVGEQYYDLSVGGLRTRLESIRHTDSANYARLDAELSGLELRRTASAVLLGVGVLTPLVTFGVFAAKRAQRPACPPMPSASTPHFERASDVWFECHRANNEIDTTPFFVGMGVTAVAVLGAMIVSPKRSELLEFVNHYNRLTDRPIRWQLGYDPARRSAFAGASLHF